MKILVIGGNRFFGKKLVRRLLKLGHQVTLLNRGSLEDGFGEQVGRIKCDRKDSVSLKAALGQKTWDLVYDQVCFDAAEAKSAVEIFKNKTPHYIFTSSQSVYDYGENISEEEFDPYSFHFTEIASSALNYAEAKKQCEAAFFENVDFDVTSVRFPIVIGADDYSQRLSFHINRIREGKPIYFPNREAKMSMISSDDAASVLTFLADHKLKGPLNAAASEPIALNDFIKIIENQLNKKAHIINQGDSESFSPYGIKKSWHMSIKKLNALGFECQPITQWLNQNSINEF